MAEANQTPKKSQAPSCPRFELGASLELGVWNLELLWSLEFGVWSFNWRSLHFAVILQTAQP